MKNGLIEYPNGNEIVKHWYLNDKLHRDDGPAIELESGYKAWYRYGMLHREDGPAVEWLTNVRYWFNPKTKIIDFPNSSSCFKGGWREWWINGKRHREDGPAIEYPNGSYFWFLDDAGVTKEEFEILIMKRELHKKLLASLLEKERAAVVKI